MPIPNPPLDNISFEDIVEEAKRKIPLLTKNWTNYNLSDPGITLIELFAWLTENQIYSLNKINKLNYLKFLKLLGVRQLETIIPSADLYLTITEGKFDDNDKPKALSPFTIKQMTKFRNRDLDLSLETNEDCEFLPSLEISKLVTFQNFAYVDEKFRDVPYCYLFGLEPKENNIFYIGIQIKDKEYFRNTKVSFNFYFYDDDLPPVGKHGDEQFEQFADEKLKSDIVWEYSIYDYTKCEFHWSSLELIEDSTNSFLNDGKVSFNLKNEKLLDDNIFKDIPGFGIESEYKWTWIRCILKRNSFNFAPRVKDIFTNTVRATLGKTETEYLTNLSDNLYEENKKLSNGLANQKFTIHDKENLPIIKVDYLKINTEEWVEIIDFDSSKPNDKHYVVDKENGIFTFGDGENGKVPNKAALIEVSYRHGKVDGSILKKGTNFELDLDQQHNEKSSVKYISGRILYDSVIGKKKESINETITRARTDLKTPFKMVSLDDYEYVVKNTPGLRIGQVKAKLSQEFENTVTISVIPYSISRLPKSNVPFLNTIRNHLNIHKLITTKLIIRNPEYIGLSITLKLLVKAPYDENVIKDKVKDLLEDYFRPIVALSGNKNRWEIGNNVYRSKLIALLESLSEIECVLDINLRTSLHKSISEIINGDVIIKNLDLVYLENLSISFIIEIS